ncbi:MFS transporter [candidate division KSB1 bacterium]|nr:MFS transporter [candidate division KSB1 bacterium]
MKKLTAVSALSCVFMLACCFVIIGSTADALVTRLGLEAGKAKELVGTLNPLFLLVACIYQFFIGPINDRVGHKPLAIFGFLATGVSMLLLFGATSMGMAKIAAALLGLGAMSLNTVGNTIIPQVLFGGTNQARASNFGNGFFGLGIVLTPLLATLMAKTASGAAITTIVLAILNVVFLVVALLSKFPAANSGFKFSTGFKLLGQAPVLMAALALFFYMGLENTMSGFLKPYANDVFGEGHSLAGLTLTLFGVAMMAGRFIAAGYKKITEKGTTVIVIVSLLSIIPMLILALTQNGTLTIIAAILAGLTFASVFPTVLGITFSKYNPQYYGSIFGMIFAIGLGGSSLVVNRIGAVGTNIGLQKAFIIPVVVAVLLVVVSLFMGKTKAKPVN